MTPFFHVGYDIITRGWGQIEVNLQVIFNIIQLATQARNSNGNSILFDYIEFLSRDFEIQFNSIHIPPLMNDRINECEWNCDFWMRANCLVQSTLHFGGKGGLAIVVTLFNVQGFLSFESHSTSCCGYCGMHVPCPSVLCNWHINPSQQFCTFLSSAFHKQPSPSSTHWSPSAGFFGTHMPCTSHPTVSHINPSQHFIAPFRRQPSPSSMHCFASVRGFGWIKVMETNRNAEKIHHIIFFRATLFVRATLFAHTLESWKKYE